MKIECQKEDMIKILDAASPITSSIKSTFVTSSNILIETDTSGIRIRSTNGELNLSAFIACEVKEEGKVAIVQDKLFHFLKQLPEGKIEIQSLENQKTLIRSLESSRKVHATIVGVNVDEFKSLPVYDEKENAIVLDKIYLKKIIQKTEFCTSQDDTKYTLKGVYLDCSENELKAVAIDGRRLALIRSKYPKHSHKSFSTILPRVLLEILKKTIVVEGPISFYFKENTIFFHFDNFEISSVVLGGNFPDYSMFIPEENKYSFVCEKKNILSAIGAVSVLMDTESRKLYFGLSKGKLNISSKNIDYGESDEEITVKYDLEEKKFGLNYSLLSDILKEIETSEVLIKFNDTLSPFVIQETNKEEYFYILMPMKIETS